MNISELARKLKITNNQLHEGLVQMGIDVGRRAIKIDNAVALKVLKNWGAYHASLAKAKNDESAVEAAGPKEKVTVMIPAVTTVRDFAVLLNIPVTRLITTLMNNGILAALNEKIDYDTAAIIAEDLGFIPKKEVTDVEAGVFSSAADPLQELLGTEDSAALITRPPIVVVMGHVDHGKTTLLDTLRKTRVVAGESGGITQHIGAYQLIQKMKKTGEVKKVTFIDTPGHEAFTTMRSRGARAADIAILVVAADDGVKPQTIEAIKIIQAAAIPVIVAINKMDKADADPDRAKRELSDHGLIPEEWGGKTVCVPISAKKGDGLDDLLEVVLLIADMEKEKIVANPAGATAATVIESHIDKNEGPVATVLVQNGTLRHNDFLVIENGYAGKVRAMRDSALHLVTEAEPGAPVRVIGFKYAPVVGYLIRGFADLPKDIEKEVKFTSSQAVVVSPVYTDEKKTASSLNIILKTDTLGSLEAVANTLLKIEHPEIKLSIVTKDLGTITSADVLKAEATKSFIAGFHVATSPSAESIASEKGVEIKLYKVIYELVDDVKARIEELLAPSLNRVVLGSVKVLKIFRTESGKVILGGAVTGGVIEKGVRTTILRAGTKMGEGKITTVQSGKQEIPRAQSGQECGLCYEGKGTVQEGDILEAFTIEKVKQTLEDTPQS